MTPYEQISALRAAGQPLLLDLFCGGGGAGMGYHRAGFTVVGIDHVPQPRYPFTFFQDDALDFAAAYGWLFDAIHASPPCEGYSSLTPKKYRGNHANLIPHVRFLLKRVNVPYVIENVAGARKFLHNPIMLCGTMFYLSIERHRYFEIEPELFDLLPPCAHINPPIPINSSSVQRTANTEECARGLQIDWLRRDEMRKAIPPAYTEYIGHQLLRVVQARIEERA